jgi:hypothetical protein
MLNYSQLGAGRRLVAELLEEQPLPESHVWPYFLWPQFGPDGHPLLDFYRAVGLDQWVGKMTYRDTAKGSQVAYDSQKGVRIVENSYMIHAYRYAYSTFEAGIRDGRYVEK